MQIELWHIYTLGGIISLVLFAQFFKLAVKNSKNDAAATILAQGIGGLSALLFVPFFVIKFSNSWTDYALLLGAIIFYGLADRIQTTVRKHLEVSVVSILSQINVIFIIIYGVLLYQEPLVFNKVLGGLLIIAANVLVLLRNSVIKLDKYVLLGMIGFFCLATGISIDIGVSRNFNLAMYVATTLLVPMLGVALLEPKAVKELKHEFHPGVRKYYLLTGFFWAVAIILQFLAIQAGSISMVVPLLATNVFLNVIIAYFMLNEKSGVIRKIVAAGFVIAGIFLINM